VEEQSLFYLLFFLFGYVTCRMLYFAKANRTSIQLLVYAQVVALYIITRALENFHYSRQYRLSIMAENNASVHNIDAFKIRSEEELSLFKNRSIKRILDAHNGIFEGLAPFEDWEDAMEFLESNKELVLDTMMKD
jgi:hypothetical protein